MLLDDIVEATRVAVEGRKRQAPLESLIAEIDSRRSPRDFAAAISGDRLKIIAEVKKASPSKSVIRADFDPVAIALEYARGGAAAISVLTEEQHFQGGLGHLRAVAFSLGKVRPPLLRKDFIIDPYQVYEARANGADAILLIAAVLSAPELASLLELTHCLGMAALVEAHDESDIEAAVASGAKIIGINNRDLRTFKVDLSTTARLRPSIPDDRIVVSESGISTKTHIDYLRSLDVNAALVGEALMKAPVIGTMLKELSS